MSPPAPDPPRRSPPGTGAGERGGITTFVVLLVVPIVLVAALAFDGGVLLAGRRHAFDVAQNAARAGAQAMDGTAARRGIVATDDGRVRDAARRYLTEVGHEGTVVVSPTTVTVTVTHDVDLQLLSILGIERRAVTGTATARLVRGVERADS